MKIQKKAAKILRSFAEKAAKETAYSVSKDSFYQPKRPIDLMEKLEKK